MRDRYYRVSSSSDMPPGAMLVHVYTRLGQVLALLDGEDETDAAEPDLVLFRAALERLRQRRLGIFVRIEDTTLWQAHWGDLVDYRGGQTWKKPASEVTPAFGLEPDLLSAWDYTLNLNSITSPSLTT
jgi:hypothetical protein